MVISQAKITSKRQITLPIKILHRLNLNPGDQIIFEDTGEHIELKSKSQITIDDFISKYQGHSTKKATDEKIRTARQEFWIKK